MIEVKQIEIRDSMTCIPALAIGVRGGPVNRLLWRAGFGEERMVILIRLNPCEANYDPFNWRGSERTLGQAHQFLANNWDSFDDRSVLDVQYLLGETKNCKISEIWK